MFHIPLVRTHFQVIRTVVVAVPVDMVHLQSRIPVGQEVLCHQTVHGELLSDTALVESDTVIERSRPTPMTHDTFGLCPGDTVMRNLPFQTLDTPEVADLVLSFIVLDIHPDFPGVSHGLYGLVLSEKFPGLSPRR